jgi:uncharacterized protein
MRFELNLNIYLLRYFDQMVSNPYRLIVTMPLLYLIFNILIFHIFGGINVTCSGGGIFCNDGLAEQFFISVIIGPVIETLLFHFLLMELLLFLFKKANHRYFLVIIISSIIFAISHRFQVHFLIMSFIGGIILASSYIIAKIKNMIPVVIVFFIHALANLGVLLINLPSRF